MPHYANGKEAKLGDVVICQPKDGSPHAIGAIVKITPSQTTCNAQLLTFARKWDVDDRFYPQTSCYTDCVTLSDCLPLVPEPADAVVV